MSWGVLKKAVFCLFVFLVISFAWAGDTRSGQAQVYPRINGSSLKGETSLQKLICEIQGPGFISPYLGQTVTVRGVVYADFDQKSSGFYLQDESCDTNPFTSDGIYVYLAQRIQVVNSGDWVDVTGTIQEYYGRTEINTTPAGVTIVSSGNLLPTPIELDPPTNNNQADGYFEAREGMYVSLDLAQVVGPTNSFEESWVVDTGLGIQRVLLDDPQGTGELICVDDRGLFKIDPQVRVGDQVVGLAGALDYAYGVYRMHLVAQPVVIPHEGGLGKPAGERVASSASFSIAQFNLADLFDKIDDPLTNDTVLTNAEYQRRLRKRALLIHDVLAEPDLLAVEEAENTNVLEALVTRPEIFADYGVVLLDSPDKRGQDVGLLYRKDRVGVLDYSQRQGCTQLVDGFGPDGNDDKYNPDNALTCDTDGDQVFDGNRLFSRPPLIVHLLVSPLNSSEQFELYVIVNHWKSQREDTHAVLYTLPRRIQEAQFTAGLVQEYWYAAPEASLVVLGDLNDDPDSQPLTILANAGLENLSSRVARPARFSYNYEGVSQVLDYILVRLRPNFFPDQVAYYPVNADYPYDLIMDSASVHRSSDHDPVIASIIHLDSRSFLPLILK
jgi:predicted extracellular nuclease